MANVQYIKRIAHAKVIQGVIGKFFVITIVFVHISGCGGPYVYREHGDIVTPVVTSEFGVMEDGYRLPLMTITDKGKQPRAVILALHGFNDYSKTFLELGNYLVEKDITVIAYDQRGFGRTKGSGYWHGEAALTNDLLTMIRFVGRQYSEVPVFVLGESMGGAVVLASLRSLQEQGGYDGLILVAPAVWAKETMPWYMRFAMWFSAHMFPWLKVSGEGLDITPSDNDEMLRALGRDPLVIKETRADSIYGLSNLMDTALASSSLLNSSTLILYGKHDEIIPRQPTCAMLKKLPQKDNATWHLILYEDGYHMLTRDLQAEKVYSDIERWVTNIINKGDPPAVGALAEDTAFICK